MIVGWDSENMHKPACHDDGQVLLSLSSNSHGIKLRTKEMISWVNNAKLLVKREKRQRAIAVQHTIIMLCSPNL